MAKRKKYTLIAGVIITLVLVAGVATAYWRHDISRTVERASLPEEIAYQEVAEVKATPNPAPAATPTVKPASNTKASPTSLPAEVNLAVPFTPQAPHANWEDPYGELCEEASVLMAISYIRGEKIPNPDIANTKLLEIKAFEDKRFGYYKDTTAAETAIIFKEFYTYDKVQLLEKPTVQDIRAALAAGKLVIVPAAGRMLANPYFQTPGPLYHMLVIKGYTDDGKFITNDPGTRRGADFLYTQENVMNAIHDWHGDEHIERGRQVVIVVG
ncbi:MAG: C39 family peptidase [Candidatus Andersenbacteria bacterium]|nr:C39 family peptidase [Candidatus Andersenbacteria bacterium]